MSKVPATRNSAILNCANLFLTQKKRPATQMKMIDSEAAIIDRDAHATT
jgi:hypothetical protein